MDKSHVNYFNFLIKAVSAELGMGDQLLKNPESVSADVNISAKTAIWFWKTRVSNQEDVSKWRFESETEAINGDIECSGGKNQQATHRWEIYQKVVGALNAQPKATEGGCYNWFYPENKLCLAITFLFAMIKLGDIDDHLFSAHS